MNVFHQFACSSKESENEGKEGLDFYRFSRNKITKSSNFKGWPGNAYIT
jgi:hypothetical protein